MTQTQLPTSKDDMMISNPYFQMDWTLETIQFDLRCHMKHQVATDWTPLVALRHTAQQVMTRNLSEQKDAFRTSVMSSAPSTLSSQSGESVLSSPPVTPMCSEFWSDLNEITSSSNSIRDRSSQQFSLRSKTRERSSSNVSVESSDTLTLVRPNPKSAVQSSLKAAKLLGIDGISTPSTLKTKTKSFPNFTRSFSATINRTPLSISTAIPSSSVPASPTRLKNMVDTKFNLFKRQSSSSLKNLDTNSELKTWVELQLTTGTRSLFRGYKQVYLVLHHGVLFRFSDDAPTTTSSHQLVISPSTIITAPDHFTSNKFDLTINDLNTRWSLRFSDKETLVTWLTHLRASASTPTSPPPVIDHHRLSLPAPSPTSPTSPHHHHHRLTRTFTPKLSSSSKHRFTIPFRPTSALLAKVPEI